MLHGPRLARTCLPAVLALVPVLSPAPAVASTTVGSTLSRPATGGYCSGDGPAARCTILQLTLGTADQVVPRDGVITRWSVRDAGGELALRVIDGPVGQRRVVASGSPVQASGSGIQTFPAQVPVRAGQRIGLELGEDGHVPFFYRDEQTTGEQYSPSLGADPAAPYPDAAPSRTYELLYSATIEPDADADGLGDETQDPDHGGAGAPAGCPASGVLASGAGSLVFRNGNRIFGCRDGRRTLIGTRRSTTRLRLFRFNGDRLALVAVVRGKSFVQVFDLGAGRREISSSRTGSAVTDLEVAPSGDAAWIATLRGDRRVSAVWVRSGARIQQIDQGAILPTSLRLNDTATSIYYTGRDGQTRNSDFA
jgi:hypothetical protein